MALALEALSEPGEATSPQRPRGGAWRWLAGAAALVVLIALAGPWSWRGFPAGSAGLPGAPSSTAGAIRSLAVLPLDNLSGDPELEYFADGMTEALIADLSQIEALPTWIAFVCTVLGDNECALDALEEAFRQRSSNMVFLRMAPAFDRLREHPRFLALLGRMNFPP